MKMSTLEIFEKFDSDKQVNSGGFHPFAVSSLVTCQYRAMRSL